MAHNLNVAEGKVSMMYVGDVPWHKLGTRLEKPATAAEAIEAAGLSFEVEKMPLKTRDPELLVLDHFATVRNDTMQVLGVVGSRYMPIQNRDAFAAFDTLVDEGEAIYHTAGVLGKGEKIWILAKLPDYIRVHGDDLVEKFMLLTNSHDGSGSVRAKLTPVRVVCENTLSLALRGAEQEVRIQHTANAQAKLERAHEVLGLTNSLYDQLHEIFNRMSYKSMGAGILNKYVDSIFPLPLIGDCSSRTQGIREKVFELAETGKGSEWTKGTLWGAYNAVTEYVDHYRQPNANDSVRLKSMWFGSGERIKKHAFNVALGMMN